MPAITKCPTCGGKLFKSSKHYRVCATCPSGKLYPITKPADDKKFQASIEALVAKTSGIASAVDDALKRKK